VEKQLISVGDLFEYLGEMYAEKTDIKVQILYEQDTITGEINLLKSVLLNLVDNACKASEAGSVVEVLGEKQETGYLFRVKDYGVGIPEEECRKITEAFYMVDKSRSRSRNGAGLGLALCVEILKLHNSELVIESTLGEGSCISFFLPYEEVTAYEKENN
jgi:signal transduction histidine kinase